MRYISEFTNNVRHLHYDQNVVADALSRVEINKVKFFQEGLNYNEIAKAQRDDVFIKSLIENPSKSSLKISEVKIEDSDQVILCDVSTDKVRPIIPEEFQKVVFDKIHNLAHSGIKATRNLLQRRFVWKNMKKNIPDWVKCYVSCQKGKIIRHSKSPSGQFNIPSGRFENLHVDLAGPLHSSNGCRYLLTVVERFSRWFTATLIKEITAEATIEAFVNGWIQYFGCPLSVVTNQGGQFTGYLWKNLMSVLGITGKHATTTSYHPQANKLVENLHRRLKDALRMQKFPDMWYFNLPIVLLVLRTAMKEDFPLSPAELVYGKDLRLPREFKTQNMPSVVAETKPRSIFKGFYP